MVLVFVKSVASVQSLFVALRVDSNINELSCKVASYSALSVVLVPESLEVCQYLSVLVRNEVYIPECFLLCVYNGVLFWSSPRYSNFISPLCLGFIFFLCQTLAKVFFFKLCCSLVSWGDGCNFSDPKDSAWVQNWMPAGECSPFYASQWTMGPNEWLTEICLMFWVVRQHRVTSVNLILSGLSRCVAKCHTRWAHKLGLGQLQVVDFLWISLASGLDQGCV
jgi:hypothetical protein